MNIDNDIFVTEENIDISFEVTEDKPFNKCFKCQSLRNGCSGPNLTVAGPKRACEFLQMMRIFFGYTYQQVADGTATLGMPVSLASVKRILTGKVANPDFYSITAISKFLLGDPNGKYPCAIPNITSELANESKLNDALRDLERALNDNADYRNAIDNINLTHKVEIDAIRDEEQKKVEYLLAENERLRTDCDKWRSESDSWRNESERKGKIIDQYINKVIPKGE